MGSCGDSTTLACRYYDSSGKDHIYVNLAKWRWCQLDNTAGCYDIRDLILHEFGHVLGLGHYSTSPTDYGIYGPGASITVMETNLRKNGQAGYNQLFYGECDVARLQVNFDVANASSRYSPCLPNINVSLSLAADSASNYSRTPVTFTAVLKVAASQSNATNAKFASHLLSGRVVTLQQSLDNGATWQSVTTLVETSTSGSGTYVRTIAVSSTRLFRAVFADPGAAEALYGATSSTWRQTVAPCTSVCPI